MPFRAFQEGVTLHTSVNGNRVAPEILEVLSVTFVNVLRIALVILADEEMGIVIYGDRGNSTVLNAAEGLGGDVLLHNSKSFSQQRGVSFPEELTDVPMV